MVPPVILELFMRFRKLTLDLVAFPPNIQEGLVVQSCQSYEPVGQGSQSAGECPASLLDIPSGRAILCGKIHCGPSIKRSQPW